MPCSSCGGGRSLSPNRPAPAQPPIVQSSQRIVTTPQAGGTGFVNRTNPNNSPPPTKRTTV